MAKKNKADAARIPIIAMTANAFAENIRAAEEAGMHAHIAKPVDVNVMMQTIAAVLSRDGAGAEKKSIM